jgi:hypothetical protein
MAKLTFGGSWKDGFLGDTLVVPLEHHRRVTLHTHSKEQQQVKLHFTTPGVAAVKYPGPHTGHTITVGEATHLEVHGHSAGETILQAHAQGSSAHGAALRIRVYPIRQIHVNFFLVQGKKGSPHFGASDVPRQVERLNHIYLPQACVHFRRFLHTSTIQLTDIDFSVAMTDAQVDKVFAALRAKVPASQLGRFSYNVFCVSHWDGHDHPGYHAWATTMHHVTIAEDQAFGDATPVLAHEAGHWFGLEHTHANGMLMTQGSAKGPHLNADQVSTIRAYLQNE